MVDFHNTDGITVPMKNQIFSPTK